MVVNTTARKSPLALPEKCVAVFRKDSAPNKRGGHNIVSKKQSFDRISNQNQFGQMILVADNLL